MELLITQKNNLKSLASDFTFFFKLPISVVYFEKTKVLGHFNKTYIYIIVLL